MSYLPQRYRKISADVALNNGSQGDSTQLAMCLYNDLLTVSVCVGHEDGNDDDDYDDDHNDDDYLDDDDDYSDNDKHVHLSNYHNNDGHNDYNTTNEDDETD